MESSIQCLLFGKVYEAHAAELAIDTIVQVRGMVEARDETISLRATDLMVPVIEAGEDRPVFVQLPAHALDMQRLEQFSQILSNHPGACEVRLAIVDDNGGVTLMTLGDRFRVRRETGLFADIKVLFGANALPMI